MSISIKARKAKARILQKWVAEKVSLLLNIPCGKDCLIQSREMGQTGVDVKLIGKALKYFPHSIECKFVEKLNIWEAIKQAKTNTIKGTHWKLFFKRSNDEVYVCMSANEFFDILKETGLCQQNLMKVLNLKPRKRL